jgi:hypothetical protein
MDLKKVTNMWMDNLNIFKIESSPQFMWIE